MTPVEQVIEALREHGCQPKRSGDGWSARCPAHEDKNPSLSLSEGADGKALVTCHRDGGCSANDICQALGLPLAALFKQVGGGASKDRRIEATYDYTDEAGELLFQTVRYFPKDFRQRHPDGNGGWVWNLRDVRRVLYRLPEVVAESDRVYLVEGEKDADRLAESGVTATTCPMGAGKWRSEYTNLLGHVGEVVVVADRDEPGRKHGRQVADSLKAEGISVVKQEPPTPHKDVSDLLDAGLELDELVALGDDREPESGGLVAVEWEAFWRRDRTEADWLIEPLIPRGRAVALYARAGQGKSELALERSAYAVVKLGLKVVYLDLEMTEDDLYDRLVDFGYGPEDDLSGLHYYLLPDLPPLNTVEGGGVVRKLADDASADMVVVDTTGRVVEGIENDADPMQDFAKWTGKPLKADGRAVLRIDHAGKDPGRGQRGTSAKADDVDVVWRLDQRENGARLRCEKRRSSWVPQTVELVRREDPVRYETVAATWPAGTAELAAELDRLGVPLEIGRPKARQILTEAGVEARNVVLGAALKWRRESQDENRFHRGQVRGQGTSVRSGTARGQANGNPSPPRAGQVRGQVGTGVAVPRGQVPPPRGGQSLDLPGTLTLKEVAEALDGHLLDPGEVAL